jgi:PAS domain-containing protein
MATGLFAIVSAAAILWAIVRWSARGEAPPEPPPAIAFLFEDGALVDATPPARALLAGLDRRASDLEAVLGLLGRRFDANLSDRLAALPDPGRMRVASNTLGGLLVVERRDGALRLLLHLADGAEGADRLRLESQERELATLRALAEDAPQPIWKADAQGSLAWANRAYLELADLLDPSSAAGGAAPWPSAPIFPVPPDLGDGQSDLRRHSVAPPGAATPLWFDVTSIRRGTDSIHFAQDANGAVAAETARRLFLRTLTETFAPLSTGLAVFDRQRRLVLFNPAFAAMSRLPPAFLTGRPLVHRVLDRLRDARLLPEPRDYATWREEVAAIEAAAAGEGYAETWALPGGETWRVMGRPHPDGALALLFEDISDEPSHARRLRAEIDACRGALDRVEEAIAVFSPTGALILANRAYELLWGVPAPGLAGAALAAEAARWQAAAAPSPLLLRLVAGESGTTAAEGLRLADGRRLRCRLGPLPGGGIEARFREEASAPTPVAWRGAAPQARAFAEDEPDFVSRGTCGG